MIDATTTKVGLEAFRKVLLDRPALPSKSANFNDADADKYRNHINALSAVVHTLRDMKTSEALEVLVLGLSDTRYSWWTRTKDANLVAYQVVPAVDSFKEATPHLMKALRSYLFDPLTPQDDTDEDFGARCRKVALLIIEKLKERNDKSVASELFEIYRQAKECDMSINITTSLYVAASILADSTYIESQEKSEQARILWASDRKNEIVLLGDSALGFLRTKAPHGNSIGLIEQIGTQQAIEMIAEFASSGNEESIKALGKLLTVKPDPEPEPEWEAEPETELVEGFDYDAPAKPIHPLAPRYISFSPGYESLSHRASNEIGELRADGWDIANEITSVDSDGYLQIIVRMERKAEPETAS